MQDQQHQYLKDIQALRNKDLPVAESTYEAVVLTMSTCTFFSQVIKFSPLSWFPMYFLIGGFICLPPCVPKDWFFKGGLKGVPYP
jgi:hypothetical protein